MAPKEQNPEQHIVDALVREAKGYLVRLEQSVSKAKKSVVLAVHAAASAEAEDFRQQIAEVYEEIEAHGGGAGDFKVNELPKLADLPATPAYADSAPTGGASK
jgi:endonuclease/exonuclease/phosphatase (EEP) superfamily protein YafD